jgi:predicted phosphohydrolase
MKFQLMSDLHMEQGSPIFLQPSLDTNLMLAGDIQTGLTQLISFLEYACENYKNVLMVAGNHDYYDSSIIKINRELWSLEDTLSNFYFLNDNQVVFDNIKIVGSTLWSSPAWGAFRRVADGQYINHRGRNLHGGDITEFNIAAGQFIDNETRNWDNTTIVMTHFGPHQGLMHKRWAAYPSLNSYFWANNCSHIFENVDYWFFGHTHDSIDMDIDGCRCICNPHGYGRPQPGYIHNLILDI